VPTIDVMGPNVELVGDTLLMSMMLFAGVGLANEVVFVRLKNSAENFKLCRSVMGNTFAHRKIHVELAGPIEALATKGYSHEYNRLSRRLA
jgi:hypothetical protein